MDKLEGEELRTMLHDLEGWELLGDRIHKDFTFPGFRGAIAFVNRIAGLADAAGHHPDLEIHYNRVVVSLSTHDAGGVTHRDLSMAGDIDRAADGDE